MYKWVNICLLFVCHKSLLINDFTNSNVINISWYPLKWHNNSNNNINIQYDEHLKSNKIVIILDNKQLFMSKRFVVVIVFFENYCST